MNTTQMTLAVILPGPDGSFQIGDTACLGTGSGCIKFVRVPVHCPG